MKDHPNKKKMTDMQRKVHQGIKKRLIDQQLVVKEQIKEALREQMEADAYAMKTNGNGRAH
jgi:hypothetical protein